VNQAAPAVGALAARVRAAGIPVDHRGLAPHASGADNEVLAARTTEVRDLIVKVPRRPAHRYGTAAWAAAALAECGVPAPRVLWHGAWDGGAACVETRCPGIPLTGTPGRLDTAVTAISEHVRQAARHAGPLLRQVHAVAVGGYGQLTADGTGPHPSLEGSILPGLTALPDAGPAGELAARARQLVAGNLWRLRDPGPRLLLGDCAARHIFHDPGTGQVSGFIDLESARGGDPMADLAGFSIREHPGLTQALLEGYFPVGATVDQAWALTLHRARIAARLMVFHLDRGEHQPAGHLAGLLTADIHAIRAQAPAVMPAQQPPPHQPQPQPCPPHQPQP
jgi:aminoglycoside phosphotransferase (APT) family kinase protein